jgi:4-hydroxyphenylacetate 3-monooxygenase
MRIAETNGVAAVPQVRTMFGRLAAEATMVAGLVIGMEAAGAMRGDCFVPSVPRLYAALSLTHMMVPGLMLAVRELAGGGVIMLPSSGEDLANADIRPMIEAPQVSPATAAFGRIAVMKLAWDALGSEFASRHK